MSNLFTHARRLLPISLNGLSATVFVLSVMTTLACLLLLLLREPATASDAVMRMSTGGNPGSAGSRAGFAASGRAWPGAGMASGGNRYQVAGSTEAEISPWQQAREEALYGQRRSNEMRADTAGITEERFVQYLETADEGDDADRVYHGPDDVTEE